MSRQSNADSPYRAASVRLASRLRDARTQRGWSQQRLAQEAQLSYQAVRAIETNSTLNPGVFTLKSMAEAMQVSLDALLAEDEAAPHPGCE